MEADCKPVTQESQWCNPVWVWKPENQGIWWCKFRYKSRRPRSPLQCSSRKKMSPPLPFLYLLIYLSPQRIEWCPPMLGGVIYFTEFTDSNVKLIWKYPHRHSQKWHLIWAPYGPVKLTLKINHHSIILRANDMLIWVRLLLLTFLNLFWQLPGRQLDIL